MSPRRALVLVVLCRAAAASAETPPPQVQELLLAADQARGGSPRGLSWQISLETTGGGETTRRVFRVRTRGNHALVESLEPARTKGETLLWSERTLWFSKPGLRKPVSVSARQRLSGLAANGDIAAAAYARDYRGSIAGVQDVSGERAWVLDLQAITDSATYERIRYYVSQERRVAVRAEFLGAGGSVLKTATFAYDNAMDQRPLISVMTLVDVASGGQTTIRYAAPSFEELPEVLFSVNNLAR